MAASTERPSPPSCPACAGPGRRVGCLWPRWLSRPPTADRGFRGARRWSRPARSWPTSWHRWTAPSSTVIRTAEIAPPLLGVERAEAVLRGHPQPQRVPRRRWVPRHVGDRRRPTPGGSPSRRSGPTPTCPASRPCRSTSATTSRPTTGTGPATSPTSTSARTSPTPRSCGWRPGRRRPVSGSTVRCQPTWSPWGSWSRRAEDRFPCPTAAPSREPS